MALSTDAANALNTALGPPSTNGIEVVAAINASTAALPQSASPLIANGVGYNTGAGGAVTQITSRATGVTLNKPTGQITTDATSLAAEANADFVVTCSEVRIGDVVALCLQSGSNGGNTEVFVVTVTNGSFTIQTSNNNAAGGTAETGALIINYVVLRGAAS